MGLSSWDKNSKTEGFYSLANQVENNPPALTEKYLSFSSAKTKVEL